MASSRRARRLRWLAPVAVAAVIGLTAFVPTLSSAATPDLPTLTPQQLLAKVQQSNVQAFSGTFQLTTDLGIPNVSGLAGSVGSAGFNPVDLLTGTHSADIKVDGPDRQQLSMPGSLSEVDVYHDGQNAWVWQSDGHKVTHVILPAHKAGANETTETPKTPEAPTPTPDQLAKQLLDQITPSTGVSVTTPAYVADQAVYELVLAPHSPDSTIDHVGIAVDANKGMPLQVTIVPKGQTKSALELGFTHISYERPSGPFSFTPPAGSTVTTKDLTKDNKDSGAQANAAPVKPAYAVGDGEHHRHRRPGTAPALQTPVPGVAAAPVAAPPGTPDTQVVGQDWTQVVIARNVKLPVQGGELRDATTPVSGAWGSGRLLHTSLGNVLFLSDGRVAAGFVSPSALEAAIPR